MPQEMIRLHEPRNVQHGQPHAQNATSKAIITRAAVAAVHVDFGVTETAPIGSANVR